MARSDFVIRNVELYDGTGSPPHRADVAVTADRISQVGPANSIAANSAIDGSGLALSPGFIDAHTHDDFAAVLHPEMGFKVQGGVTTCIVGNCGFGAAPWSAASQMAPGIHPKGELPEWDGYGGYYELLDREPPSVNIGALTGHGTIRAAVVGSAPAATAGQIRAMRDLVREGLDAGALGMSSGLVYEPGRHADTAELVAVASEMAGTTALYTTHMRNEGAHLLDSVREAIEIGERAGVAVQISHHKATGRQNWGLVNESLKLIEDACNRGLDVSADQYPYTAGSTILSMIVASGGVSGDSDETGEAIRPSDLLISSTANHREWEGRTLEDLAAEFGLNAVDAADKVLQAEPDATTIIFAQDEIDVQTVMAHPSTMIGSDGLPTLDGRPHPRLYGTFARVLGHYARDKGLFSMEDAIRRMTGFPATKFGLKDRGVIHKGGFADLVLFDPGTICDVATYEDPQQHSAGIIKVWVNGELVVSDGAHTGKRPGRALRRVD